jgi:hypothetical protein
MAKKSRRVRKKGRGVRLSEAQMLRPGTGEMSIAPTVAVQARPVVRTSDLREEYRYVITDLKRIGVIAAAMLVVLVALAFLLA